jgi:hypothetical protein
VTAKVHEAAFLQRTRVGRQERGESVYQVTRWVGDALPAGRPGGGVARAYQRAGVERRQLQRLQVQNAPCLGIAVQEDVEASVQQPALWVHVGAYSSACAVARLQQHHIHACAVQRARARQAGHTCADDDDVRRVGFWGG